MRVAVISDIHGNSENLETVLLWAKEIGVDEIWFLGDLVGGRKPDPKPLELVREHAAIALAGNHDYAATGRFPQFLQFLSPWWRGTLNIEPVFGEKNYSWLKGLPPQGERAGVELFHGNRSDPVMGFLNEEDAVEHLSGQTSYLSLVGHTHRPLALWMDSDGIHSFEPDQGDSLEINPEAKAVLNPGTLGFQQNKTVSDRRSGWMLLEGEDETFTKATWHRL